MRWPLLTIILALLLSGGCDAAPKQATSGPDFVPRDLGPPSDARPATVSTHDCSAPAFAAAAGANTASLRTLAFAPFRREEFGWEIYAPAIGVEIGSRCAPDSQRFASDLAAWQKRRGLPADGVLTPQVFEALKTAWRERRPHLALREAEGACPAPPDEATLATATAAESFGGKTIQLQLGALYAYRRMVAAARAEVPEIAADPTTLTIFSGYRSPDYDAARCERDQNCDGVVRASCSPHRTGRVVDVVVGHAPGFNVDQSDDVNRLHMSRTPAYRWMVANAHRFGFYNYVFEPWHWEWLGYAPHMNTRQAGAPAQPRNGN
jgi:D-alanyl-D-alanine dipeptidase